MSDYLPLGIERNAEYEMDELTSDQRRSARAVTERMVVLPRVRDDGTATGMYDVLAESRNGYVCDLVEGAGNCPDQEYNEPENGCKHLRRVRLLQNLPDVRFPGEGDDVADYAARLAEVAETMSLERSMLEKQVIDDDADDVAVGPSAPTEEYRVVDWFLTELRDHDVMQFAP